MKVYKDGVDVSGGGGGPPTGSAGGDLAGTYPNPTVANIHFGSDAQGDIAYRGASAWARLGAGTAGKALLTGGAAANPSFDYPNVVGRTATRTTFQGGAVWQRVTTATDYTVQTGDYLVEVTGNSAVVTITLPGAATAGATVVVVDKDRHADTYRIKIVAASGLVAGLATVRMFYPGQSITFESDGTDWHIVSATAGLLIDPSLITGLNIKTRFVGYSGVTLDTGAVSSWAPFGAASGYTAAATQSTAANRPTVSTAWSGGEDALTFDGSNDLLSTGNWSGGTIAVPYTFYAVAASGNVTTGAIVSDDDSTAPQLTHLSGTQTRFNASTALDTSATDDLWQGSWTGSRKKVVACVNNSTSNSSIYVGGRRVVFGNAGTSVFSGLTIGALNTPASWFNGVIAEIIVCSGMHSGWMIKRVSDYLRDFWQLGV